MAITFSEFLQKLYNFCSGNDNTSTFVTTVLEKIIFNRDNDDLAKKVAAFNMDENDLRKIYNGKKTLSATSIRYILSHIDKQNFAEFITDSTTDDARILLCEEFEPNVGNADKDNIADKIATLLVNILKEIVVPKNKKTDTLPLQQISKFDTEQELTEIVKALALLPQERLNDLLKYKPYNVDKKVLPENAILKKDIKQDVVDFYLFVEGLFNNATAKNSLFFDQIAEQVKIASDNYISQGLPQEIVFNNMVDWLQSKVAFASRSSCRIIISFFVQNCEVFHAFTE